MWVGKHVILRWAIVALIFIAGMIWAYSIITESSIKMSALPVYGHRNNDSTDHTVSDFRLTDQNSKIITGEDYKNKIYVADFFFTTCQGICPLMSDQMERVAERYKGNQNVLFLSHTVKPEEDSVPLLKQYAIDHHADDSQWHFVTGDKHVINHLAFTSYLVTDTISEFVHTQFFALIDKQKRIRGYYDGTDSTEVNKLIGDIAVLLREE